MRKEKVFGKGVVMKPLLENNGSRLPEDDQGDTYINSFSRTETFAWQWVTHEKGSFFSPKYASRNFMRLN